jgi:addiction module RelB/DinJ family antitoxin
MLSKEMVHMEKTTTLNLRVNPDVKRRAEEVLAQLGMPMSTAIDIYLKQISMTGGIPFAITLPKAPASVNADLMTTDEIHAKLKEGYNDIEKGNVQDASAAFHRFREKHA